MERDAVNLIEPRSLSLASQGKPRSGRGLRSSDRPSPQKVIDEFFLTLAPQIAGRQTIAQRPSLAGETLFLPKTAPWFELRSVKQAFNHLLLRYTTSGVAASLRAAVVFA
jgi:hypothetical protein